MCDTNCNYKDERDRVFELLQEFDCLKDIIDKIKIDYKNKAFIGKITSLIADSNEFIYYGGPPKYKQKNEKTLVNGCYDILNNFKKPELEYSSHYNYWLKCRKENEEMPESIKSHCLCFHCIKNLCFIKSKITEKIYTIGIECINKFTISRRTCSKCSKPHRNSKDNYCNDCREDIKEIDKILERKKQEEIYNTRKEYKFNEDYICKFGKYKGEGFDIVFEDKKYIKWALSIFDINKKDNIYFLIKLYQDYIN